ncbi:MAG: gas vesicle protein GvpG [Candidatus Omnitrophica bacterium]|nr:gas vesicle protein GvpG [Candidatus Omnitrophota bacterium]
MLLVDKLLLFPIHATLWVARQVNDAVEQDRSSEPERITAQLSELYMMLETGKISESEFTEREHDLLDRLDQIQGQDVEDAGDPAGAGFDSEEDGDPQEHG